MSQQKDKIAELHRQVERERARKQKMYEGVVEALTWWTKTNLWVETIMKDSIGVIQTATDNRLKFLDWLMISPWKPVSRLAEKLSDFRGKRDIWKDTCVYEAKFHRWKIQCLLAEQRSYSVEEIAGKLGIPVAAVKEIIQDIIEEKTSGVKQQTIKLEEGKVKTLHPDKSDPPPRCDPPPPPSIQMQTIGQSDMLRSEFGGKYEGQ